MSYIRDVKFSMTYSRRLSVASFVRTPPGTAVQAAPDRCHDDAEQLIIINDDSAMCICTSGEPSTCSLGECKHVCTLYIRIPHCASEVETVETERERGGMGIVGSVCHEIRAKLISFTAYGIRLPTVVRAASVTALWLDSRFVIFIRYFF